MDSYIEFQKLTRIPRRNLGQTSEATKFLSILAKPALNLDVCLCFDPFFLFTLAVEVKLIEREMILVALVILIYTVKVLNLNHRLLASHIIPLLGWIGRYTSKCPTKRSPNFLIHY